MTKRKKGRQRKPANGGLQDRPYSLTPRQEQDAEAFLDALQLGLEIWESQGVTLSK